MSAWEASGCSWRLPKRTRVTLEGQIHLADQQPSYLLNPGKGELSSRQQVSAEAVLRHLCCNTGLALSATGLQQENQCFVQGSLWGRKPICKKVMVRIDAVAHGGLVKEQW